MDPIISSIIEEDEYLNFTIKNINVSFANAIRRIILSEIPIIIFKTFPHKENKCNIITNTSKFNNEIIKQRLSCIPINIDDINFPIQDYLLEINVVNNSNEIIYVTSKDFKIKNIKTDTYISEVERDKIFPPNNITNNYIDFLVLRPKIKDSIPGEEIELYCKFDIGIAKDSGMYNVVSTCSYGNSLDDDLINTKWSEHKNSLDTDITPEDLEYIKKDWFLLDAQRHYIENSFDFTIESIGIYSNIKICELACNIMIDKCKLFINNIQTKDIINNNRNYNENCYDITLENEDYTLGKSLEYIIINNYFNREVSFCSFKKEHPHTDVSIIRIIFKDDVDNNQINAYLLETTANCISVFEKILSNFTM